MANITFNQLDTNRTEFLKYMKAIIRYVKMQIRFRARTGESLIADDVALDTHKYNVSMLNQYLETNYKLDFDNEPELKEELAALEEKYERFTGSKMIN